MTQHRHVRSPSFFGLTFWILFAVLFVSIPLSSLSIAHNLLPLAPVARAELAGQKLTEDQQQSLVQGFFKAIEAGWYWHLGVSVSLTFLAGRAFRSFPQTFMAYCCFAFCLFVALPAAWLFFLAEFLADLIKESDKLSYAPEVATVKLCSLILAAFSIGFSYEMGRALFLESKHE